MKEKIKEWIFIGFVFLSTVICILAISAYNNSVSYISLSNKDVIKEVEVYEKELKFLEQNECTAEIEKWINYYKENSYTYINVNEFIEKFILTISPGVVNINKCIGDNNIIDRHKKNAIAIDMWFNVGLATDLEKQYIMSFPYSYDYYDYSYAYDRYAFYMKSILEIIEDMIRYEKEKVVDGNVEE